MKIESILSKPKFYSRPIEALKSNGGGADLLVSKSDDCVNVFLQNDYEETLFMSEMTHEEARFLAKSLLAMVGEEEKPNQP